jgi:hypothetical protein
MPTAKRAGFAQQFAVRRGWRITETKLGVCQLFQFGGEGLEFYVTVRSLETYASFIRIYRTDAARVQRKLTSTVEEALTGGVVSAIFFVLQHRAKHWSSPVSRTNYTSSIGIIALICFRVLLGSFLVMAR